MASSSQRDDESTGRPSRKTVRLTAEEVAMLRRALKKYRTTLPVYLQSMRREVELIDGLLERIG